jgi:hypothetical protein
LLPNVSQATRGSAGRASGFHGAAGHVGAFHGGGGRVGSFRRGSPIARGQIAPFHSRPALRGLPLRPRFRGVFIGGVVVAAPIVYAYAPPYPYPSPYYAYAPGYAIPDAASTYMQPGPAPAYWYYCAALNAYYPYVQDCPEGWQQVAPQPPPPPS